MLVAREEVIERILKSADMHDLDDAQMLAVCIHASAGVLIEKYGTHVSRREVHWRQRSGGTWQNVERPEQEVETALSVRNVGPVGTPAPIRAARAQ